MDEFFEEKYLYRTTLFNREERQNEEMCFSVNPVKGGPGKGI